MKRNGGTLFVAPPPTSGQLLEKPPERPLESLALRRPTGALLARRQGAAPALYGRPFDERLAHVSASAHSR